MNFLIYTGKFFIGALISLLFAFPLYSQHQRIEYGAETEVATSLSSDQLPFWLYSERRQDQYSFLWDLNFTLPQLKQMGVNVSTALDTGKCYDDTNLAFQVGIQWNGAFK